MIQLVSMELLARRALSQMRHQCDMCLTLESFTRAWVIFVS